MRSAAAVEFADEASEGVASAIKAAGIIAIIRGDFTVEQTVAITETLVRESITVIEVALNSTHALDSIDAVRRAFGDAALIGAGTVRSAGDVDRAVAAGARFAVAPSFVLTTLDRARAHHLFYLPGVLTPTEAERAYTAGCRMQKLFPSDALGPRYLSALRTPLNEIEFVPTGGVSADNIALYAAAGAVAVGVGSSLVAGPRQSLDELAERARSLRRAWQEAR